LAGRLAAGVETQVIEVLPGVESVLAGLPVSRPERDSSRRARSVYHVMTGRNGRIVAIRALPSRAAAGVQARIDSADPRRERPGKGSPVDGTIELRGPAIPVLDATGTS
jgi:hypothetical protein